MRTLGRTILSANKTYAGDSLRRFAERQAFPSEVVSLRSLQVRDVLLARSAVDRTHVLACEHGIVFFARHALLRHQKIVQVLDLKKSTKIKTYVLLERQEFLARLVLVSEQIDQVVHHFLKLFHDSRFKVLEVLLVSFTTQIVVHVVELAVRFLFVQGQ